MIVTVLNPYNQNEDQTSSHGSQTTTTIETQPRTSVLVMDRITATAIQPQLRLFFSTTVHILRILYIRKSLFESSICNYVVVTSYFSVIVHSMEFMV